MKQERAATLLRKVVGAAGVVWCLGASPAEARDPVRRPMEGLRRAEPPTRLLIALVPAGALRSYASGTTVDVNLAALAFEWPVHERIGVHVRPWVTLRIRPDLREVGHLGATVMMPVYSGRAGRGWTRGHPWDGPYLAPLIEGTGDRLHGSGTIAMGAEVGWRLALENDWSATFGIQAGVGFIVGSPEDTDPLPHAGLYLSVGRWIR